MQTEPTPDFLTYMSSIEDPRQAQKLDHPLEDILFLSTCAVIAGADGPTEIQAFGEDRLEWLRKFVPLQNGVPSHDTIGRVFSLIDVEAFQQAFLDWARDFFTEHPPSQSAKEMGIAIDGKSLRGSARKGKGIPALHLVSAWSLETEATLRVKSVEKKSNEITTIPLLLRELELRDAIVTIDAMGCQTEIASTIIDRGGDYILAVKENQPTLLAAIIEAFDARSDREILPSDRTYCSTEERSRGRNEHRGYQLIAVPKSMAHFKERWSGLKTIGMATSIVERDGKETSEVRYFISSLRSNVERFAKSVRGHWGIENKNHWVLDMSFGEDACRVRNRIAAANLGLLRRFSLSVIKQEPSKKSLVSKRRRANRNPDFLESCLFS